MLKGEITFTVFRCKSDPSSPDTEDAELLKARIRFVGLVAAALVHANR